MAFSRNVFINCPFDKEYQDILKPILFTLKYLGFTPRIANERFDSGEVRLDKIEELLMESQFSIHDLSRIKAKYLGEYFRLNMPFELGLDLGCKKYHENKFRKKKFLILESEKYAVQKGLSDLSFGDCKCHNNDPETTVTIIRNWFVEVGFVVDDPPSKIWDHFNYFYSNLFIKKKKEGFSKKEIEELPILEFLDAINYYLNTL
jgi:hypothetical protein